jgi:excisionase family DNA binding protein
MAAVPIALRHCPVRLVPGRVAVRIGAAARPPVVSGEHRFRPGSGTASESAARKGCAVAAQRAGNTAPDTRSYLRTAEVADILHVSPKTVSRRAKEGKLPFLKTLGGHRRYPAAEIRQLADELQVRPTA